MHLLLRDIKFTLTAKKKRMWVWEENVEKLKRGKRGLKPILAIIMKRPNDLYAKKAVMATGEGEKIAMFTS